MASLMGKVTSSFNKITNEPRPFQDSGDLGSSERPIAADNVWRWRKFRDCWIDVDDNQDDGHQDDADQDDGDRDGNDQGAA